jgi:recombinational DNA repair protein (RecF pathway)
MPEICLNCRQPSTNVYRDIYRRGYLCRDCHEMDTKRHAMELTYGEEDAERAVQTSGIRVLRKPCE